MQESHRTDKYVPYPHDRPGPDKTKMKKSEIEPDINLRKFNFAARPVPTIRKFDWEAIKAVAISDSGTQGVIFVETDEGAIVVKGSSDAAIDFFLYKLLRVLNVTVPHMRVLRWYDNEFKVLIKNLERATFNDEILGRRITSRIDMAYLQIQEYIPGISISNMGPHRAACVFEHTSPESRDRLIRLGLIIAFDTLINNSDRYPLLWGSGGNPNNIIVKMKTNFLSKTEQLHDPENLTFDYGKFYALDSALGQTNSHTEQGLQALVRYFNKLETFLNDLFLEMKDVMTAQIDPMLGIDRQGGRKGFKSVGAVSNFIYEHTLYHMEEMQIFQVMLGIIVGIENACQLGIDRIQMMYQKFFLKDTDDWRGIWNDNLRKVNLMMYNDCILVYSKFRGAYSDVIKWVKDITLNQYHLRIEEFEQIVQGNIYEDIDETIDNSKSNIFDDPDQPVDTTNPVLDQNQSAISVQNDINLDANNDNPPQKEDDNLDFENDLHKRIKNVFDLDIDDLNEQYANNPSLLDTQQNNTVNSKNKNAQR